MHVEKEIKRLNDEADRQIRLLKHKSDIVRHFMLFFIKKGSF